MGFVGDYSSECDCTIILGTEDFLNAMRESLGQGKKIEDVAHSECCAGANGIASDRAARILNNQTKLKLDVW